MDEYGYPKNNTFKKVAFIVFIVLLGIIFLASCAGWIKQKRSEIKANNPIATEIVTEPTRPFIATHTPTAIPTTQPKPTAIKLADPSKSDGWNLVFYDGFGANFWFREVGAEERGCQYIAKVGCAGKTVEVFLTTEPTGFNYYLNGWDIGTHKAIFSFDLRVGLNTVSVPPNVKLGVGTLIPQGLIPTLPTP